MLQEKYLRPAHTNCFFFWLGKHVVTEIPGGIELCYTEAPGSSKTAIKCTLNKKNKKKKNLRKIRRNN